MAEDRIRRTRVRQFLRAHLYLCGFALVVSTVETLSGVQTKTAHIVGTYLTTVLALIATFIGFRLMKRAPRTVPYIPPVILVLDTCVILVQLFLEGGLESGWAAVPVFATILMPLFVGDRRLVWGLAGLQIGLWLLLYVIRVAGWIEYTPRTPSNDVYLYSSFGHILVILGAAAFAGWASLDVLNSQQQLQREIDQATAALREAQAQLVQQAKMAGLGQLTAGVAHEINNPLTFVQTNITSIGRDVTDILEVVAAFNAQLPALEKADPAAAQRLRDMQDEIGLDEEMSEMVGELLEDTADGLARVQRIISDLRTFSRADTASRKQVDLQRALEDAIAVFEKECGDAVVTVAFAVLPEVPAYPLLLNQVFLNILRNACDAVPEDGGRIEVHTRLEGDMAVIEVSDNGPGVPVDIRDRIFDPFFTTKEVGDGTGLGLAISYQIIESHRGRLEVDDAEGGGGLFRVALPLVVVEVEPDEQPA